MIRNKNMSNKSKVSIKKATKVDLKSKIHAELDYWAKRIEKSKQWVIGVVKGQTFNYLYLQYYVFGAI